MHRDKLSPIILIAEDDEDDYLLVRDAFLEFCQTNDLRWVKDGEELMDYLFCRGKYEDPRSAPWPGIILLDLNMPKKDGREALKEIKSHPELRRIPVVALTTSNAEEDILYAYGMGANSFIRKPTGFGEFVDVMKVFDKYWHDLCQLPR
ncbi:MAG TPA: response regulator [Candidatus Eisenbacteria bacterium]|jgi:CheY-like chemotaxis protein|nr:response regulator [Candidatus Eisenbacteria bacterium]